MRDRCAIVVVACLTASCELNITSPSPAAVTLPPTPGVSITNTNTNTSTNQNDRTDTGTPQTPTPTPSGQPLPLPANGEAITRSVAAANPTLLANSCQDTTGESAWQFLDLLIRTLRNTDPRWGYLCKDGNCLHFGRDVVTYKATNADTGIWIVDVIGGHCPGPTDPPPAIRWGVLPFETVRRWAAARTPGGTP